MKTDVSPNSIKADFSATLDEINEGASKFELSQALEKLTKGVRETGKGGKLVYTIKIDPVAGTKNQVSVADDIDLKLPKNARFKSLFFASQDNRLCRDDPDQMQMPGIDHTYTKPRD